MPNFIPVNTQPTDFVPGSISDEEAAAMWRASLELFKRWQVTDQQAATLLDMTHRTFARWKVSGSGRISRDCKARLSNLIGIHKALRIIFRDPERAYAWIRASNTAFDEQSALDVMLDGELTDLMRVRRYLDAERGAW